MKEGRAAAGAAATGTARGKAAETAGATAAGERAAAERVADPGWMAATLRLRSSSQLRLACMGYGIGVTTYPVRMAVDRQHCAVQPLYTPRFLCTDVSCVLPYYSPLFPFYTVTALALDWYIQSPLVLPHSLVCAATLRG